MASRRKAIRKAIKAALVGKTSAGAQVFDSISSALWAETLPTIAIYCRSESVEEQNSAPREYKRTIELVVECIAEGGSAEDPSSAGPFLDDVLDDISDQVELELNRDETLGPVLNALGQVVALVDEILLNNVEFEYRGEGRKPTGSCRLVFFVTYYEHRPGSIEEQDGVGDLKTVDAKWKVGHDQSSPDNVVEAEDTLDIPD